MMFYQILKLGDRDGNLKSVTDVHILCDGHTCATATFISTKVLLFLALKSRDIYLLLHYDDYNFF